MVIKSLISVMKEPSILCVILEHEHSLKKNNILNDQHFIEHILGNEHSAIPLRIDLLVDPAFF
jgi:hypothetical protein